MHIDDVKYAISKNLVRCFVQSIFDIRKFEFFEFQYKEFKFYEFKFSYNLCCNFFNQSHLFTRHQFIDIH